MQVDKKQTKLDTRQKMNSLFPNDMHTVQTENEYDRIFDIRSRQQHIIDYKEELKKDIDSGITRPPDDFIDDIKRLFENYRTDYFKRHLNKQTVERYVLKIIPKKTKNIASYIVNKHINKSITEISTILDKLNEDIQDEDIQDEDIQNEPYNNLNDEFNAYAEKLDETFSDTALTEVDIANKESKIESVTNNIITQIDNQVKTNPPATTYKDELKNSFARDFVNIHKNIIAKITDFDTELAATQIVKKLIPKSIKINFIDGEDLRLKLLESDFKRIFEEVLKNKLSLYSYPNVFIDTFVNKAVNKLIYFIRKLDIGIRKYILVMDSPEEVIDEIATALISAFFTKNETEKSETESRSSRTLANDLIAAINEDIFKVMWEKLNNIPYERGVVEQGSTEHVVTEQGSTEHVVKEEYITEQIITNQFIIRIVEPIAHKVILDKTESYIKNVVQTTLYNIAKDVENITVEINAPDFYSKLDNERLDLYTKYRILYSELYHKKYGESINMYGNMNIVKNLNIEFNIFGMLNIIITILKTLTKENTDVYDILLTLFKNFADSVFGTDYCNYLIENEYTPTNDNMFSEFKYLTIKYVLIYAEKGITLCDIEHHIKNKLRYMLQFDENKLDFIYYVLISMSQTEPDIYIKLYNTLIAYFHFQDNLARLTNIIDKLNDNEKNIIRAISYVSRSEISNIRPIKDVHNNLYSALHEIYLLCKRLSHKHIVMKHNKYYVLTVKSNINKLLTLIATHICYYVIFITAYKIIIYNDDSFLEKIDAFDSYIRINITNEITPDTYNEIRDRLQKYKLIKMVDINILSNLVEDTYKYTQYITQKIDVESIKKIIIDINDTIDFDTNNDITIDLDDNDITSIENKHMMVKLLINEFIPYLRIFRIHNYIQHEMNTSNINSSIQQAIRLFNNAYKCVLTGDDIIYNKLALYINTIDYFNIECTEDITFSPYTPQLILNNYKPNIDAFIPTEIRILLIYYYNMQLIYDALTTNQTERHDADKISEMFKKIVKNTTNYKNDYNYEQYNVLYKIYGSKTSIDEHIIENRYFKDIKEIFGANLHNETNNYNDIMIHDFRGGNGFVNDVVNDNINCFDKYKSEFIENELSNMQRNNDLYGGMYTPTHDMLTANIDITLFKEKILYKFESNLDSMLDVVCYDIKPENEKNVLTVIKDSGHFNDVIERFKYVKPILKTHMLDAIRIGLDKEFNTISDLPILYKKISPYFEVATKCAICEKDIDFLNRILPISNRNALKVIFKDSFDYRQYSKVIRLIYSKLNNDEMYNIYDMLLENISTDGGFNPYIAYNDCIDIECFAVSVYFVTVDYYLNLPNKYLSIIIKDDASKYEKSDKVEKIHKSLLNVRKELARIVQGSDKHTTDAYFKTTKNKIVTEKTNKRKLFTHETILYMYKILANLYTTNFTSKDLLDKFPLYIATCDVDGEVRVETKYMLGLANLTSKDGYYSYTTLYTMYESLLELENSYYGIIYAKEKPDINTLMFERKIINAAIGLVYKHLSYDIYNSITVKEDKEKINNIIRRYSDTLKDTVIYCRYYDMKYMRYITLQLDILIDNFKQILNDGFNIYEYFKTSMSPDKQRALIDGINDNNYNAVNEIRNYPEVFYTTVDEISNKHSEIIYELIDLYPEILCYIIDKYPDMLHKLIDEIKANDPIILQSLINAYPEILSILINSNPDALRISIDEIKDKDPNILQILIDIHPNILYTLIDKYPTILHKLIDEIKVKDREYYETLINAYPEILHTLIDKYPTILHKLIDEIKVKDPNILQILIDNYPDISHTLIKENTEITRSLIDKYPTMLHQLIDKIKVKYPDILQILIDKYPTMPHQLINKFPDILHKLIDEIKANDPIILRTLMDRYKETLYTIINNHPTVLHELIYKYPDISHTLINEIKAKHSDEIRVIVSDIINKQPKSLHMLINDIINKHPDILQSLINEIKAKHSDEIRVIVSDIINKQPTSFYMLIHECINNNSDILHSLINGIKDKNPDYAELMNKSKEVHANIHNILMYKMEDIITSAIRTYYYKLNGLHLEMRNKNVELTNYPDKNYDVAKTYLYDNYPKCITGFGSLIQAYEGLISPFISFLIYLLSNNTGNYSLSACHPNPIVYYTDKNDYYASLIARQKDVPAFKGGLAYDGEMYDYDLISKIKLTPSYDDDIIDTFQRSSCSNYVMKINKKLCSYDIHAVTDDVIDKLLNMLLRIDFHKTNVNDKEIFDEICFNSVNTALDGVGIHLDNITQDQIESLEKLKRFMLNIVVPSMNLCIKDNEIVSAMTVYDTIKRRTFEHIVICIDRNKAATVAESNFKVELLRRLISRVYNIGYQRAYHDIPESVTILSSRIHVNATVGRNLLLDYVRKNYSKFNRLLTFMCDDDDILNIEIASYALDEVILLNLTTNVIICNQNTSKQNVYIDGSYISRYAVWSFAWSPFVHNLSIRVTPMNKEDLSLYATIIPYNENAVILDIFELSRTDDAYVMYEYISPVQRNDTISRYNKNDEFRNPYAIEYVNTKNERDQGYDRVIVPVSTHTTASAKRYTFTIGQYVLNNNALKELNQNLYGLPLLRKKGKFSLNRKIVHQLDDYSDSFVNDTYELDFNANRNEPRHVNRENLNGDVAIVFYDGYQLSLAMNVDRFCIIEKHGDFVACQDGKITSPNVLRSFISDGIENYYEKGIPDNDFTNSLLKCSKNELYVYVEVLLNEMFNPEFCAWNTRTRRFYKNIVDLLNAINYGLDITEDNANIFVPNKVRGGNAKVFDIVIKILLIIAIVLMIVVIISIIVTCVQKQSKIKQIIHRHNPIKYKY